MHRDPSNAVESAFELALGTVVRQVFGDVERMERTRDAPLNSWPTARLGFGGPLLSGLSVLVTEPAGAPADPDGLDELNRELVEHLASTLAELGLRIRASTPRQAAGGLLGVGAARHDPSRWRVRWHGGVLIAELRVAFASHVRIDLYDNMAAAV